MARNIGVRSGMRKGVPLVLILVLIFGATIRLIDIGAKPLWLDETITIRQADQAIGTTLQFLENDSHFPLYVALMNLWVHLFGSGEIIVRLPSLIFSVISIYVIYLLGSAVYSRRVGLISAVLLCISSSAVYYAQEARLYSLFLLLTMLSTYFYLRIVDKPGKSDYCLYILFTSMMIYTHIFSFITFTLQSGYYLYLHRLDRKKILAWFGIIAAELALFLPWMHMLIQQIHYNRLIDWIPQPTPALLAGTVDTLSGNPILAILIVGIAIFLAYRSKLCKNNLHRSNNRRDASLGRYTVMLLLFLVTPILLVYVFSSVSTHLFFPKYFFFLSGFFLIICAYLLDRIKRRSVLLIVLGILLATSLARIIIEYNAPDKQDWRGTAEFLRENVKQGEYIIVHPYYYDDPFAYYYDPYCFGEYYLNSCLYERDEILSANYLATFYNASTKMTATSGPNTLGYYVNRTGWLVTLDNTSYPIDGRMLGYLETERQIVGTWRFADGIIVYELAPKS